MAKTKSKPETSHSESQFSPDSIVCIKATHPLWAGECCTVVARPSTDAAIVELRLGDREYIALRYLQPACNHKFHPVWQTDGSLFERCDCGETRPPLLLTLATVLDRLTEVRNERPAAVSDGNRQVRLSQSLENVEHRIKWLSEQLEQMNGQVQESTCEDSHTVDGNLQEPVANCKKLAPSKAETVEVLPAVMTEVEARQCVSDIKTHFTSIRVLVLDLEERRGWETLGYTILLG